MNPRLLPIVFLPIVFALMAVCGLAQKPKGFDVQVNLLVTDEKGEYVDVKDSDIKILDDGVEQKIISVRKVDGLDLCILVDNSGSMANRFDDIPRVPKVLVNNLRLNDQASIIRFVSRDKIETQQPWTADKKLLIDGLDNLYIEGGQSAVVDALYLASQDVIKRERSAPNRRYAILLISDTDDRNSFYNEKQFFELVKNDPLQVFTIAFTKDLKHEPSDRQVSSGTIEGADRFAKRLSVATHGASFSFGPKVTRENLIDAVKALILQLRAQYVVTYTPTNGDKDDIRKLSASVADGPIGEKRRAVVNNTFVLVP